MLLKYDLDVQQTHLRFVKKTKLYYRRTTKCNPMIVMTEFEAGLLNKSSCLAPALGVTNFTTARDMILVTL